MTTLLSVDWDYFVPSPRDLAPDNARVLACADWGASERMGALEDQLWYIRIAQLDGLGIPRPQLHPLTEVSAFWDRFALANNALVYVADSHSYAYHPEVRAGVDAVWNYDAHHDAGYRWTAQGPVLQGVPTCEDWMLWYYHDGVSLHQRYPLWRIHHPEPWGPIAQGLDIDVSSDIDPPDVVFDRIVIARSGAWVPPYLDLAFTRFVQRACRRVVGVGPLRLRSWDEDVVADHADSIGVLLRGR